MRISCALLCLVIMLCGLATATAPNLVSYQGRLTTSSGQPVADGAYAVTFAIYSVPSGGSPLWTETQTVASSNGLFSVVLGATIPFTQAVFADSTRYLGIKVGLDPELAPRTRLTSAPFALGAASAWTDDGPTVRLTTLTDYVGIGTATPIHPFHVSDPSDGVFISRFEGSNSGAMVTEFSNTSVPSVWELSIVGSAGVPGWGLQPGDLYYYKQGTAFPAAVMTSGRNLGLGTAIPRARLEAVTTDTMAGYFLAAGASSATKVVSAEYSGSSSVDAIAVYGKSSPADYYGYGGWFEGGYMGVYASVTPSGTGQYYGVQGTVSGSGSGEKTGVDGSVSSASTGPKFGVRGQATSWSYDLDDTTFGVFGYAYGSNSYTRGVFGKADGYFANGGYFEANGVYAKGVYIDVTGDECAGLIVKATGTGSEAAWFFGATNVQGTLSKTAGSFRIDHPLDPENKYLQHSFVESPDMLNVYNGNVTLDASGEAVVSLPDYFEALNKDFRYQLTCIGGYAPIYVAQKVSTNTFRIAGGTPGLEVSWQVTGVRKDVYAEAHRIAVEVDKRADEQGKYLHPELFGKGTDMQIGARGGTTQSEVKPWNPTMLPKEKSDRAVK